MMYRIFVVLACSFFISPVSGQNVPGHSHNYLLLPQPQHIEYDDSECALQHDRYIWLDMPAGDETLRLGQLLQKAMQQAGVKWEITTAKGNQEQLLGIKVKVDPVLVPQLQGYQLKITPGQITILGHDNAGVFYAAQTILQITQQTNPNGKLPCLEINDWPDFPNRGVMLDISRDKVPTMETLYSIIDRLSSWKINQFQLYTEHTFAYRGHRIVWEKASPMTGEQIMQLDSYCRQHYIELVPNQNSFGHMERWLKHNPYSGLAEEFGVCEPDGSYKSWTVLCPVDPNSIEFLAGLYDELLPHFTSKQFNVGCDETWSLGEGRSKAVADVKGKGRIYLDFLLQIHQQTAQHGRQMQFWADIILNHPEFLTELPDDIIALIWGYDANHPYDKQCKQVADAKKKFYVCPGTSTWRTIAGRLTNAKENLWNAAENGKKYGAIGFLNTNWGDWGHWENLPFSWPPFAYGAAVSWASEANKDVNLPAVLDTFVFEDKAKVMGKVICDLGTYQIPDTNGLANWSLELSLRKIKFDWSKDPEIQPFTAENLKQTLHLLEDILAQMKQSQMHCQDAAIVTREIENAGALLMHCVRAGIAKLSAPDQKFSKISMQERQILAKELSEIIPEFRRVWVLRNRPGGLDDSVTALEQTVGLYQADMSEN